MIIDKIGKQGKKHKSEPQRFVTFSFYLFPNEIYDIFFTLYEHELAKYVLQQGIYDIFFPLYEHELENLFCNREVDPRMLACSTKKHK